MKLFVELATMTICNNEYHTEYHAEHQLTCKQMLRNIFRDNLDEELTIVRKTESDNETYRFVCFLA